MRWRIRLTSRRFRMELLCVNQIGLAGVLLKFGEWLVKFIDLGRIADDKGVPHWRESKRSSDQILTYWTQRILERQPH